MAQFEDSLAAAAQRPDPRGTETIGGSTIYQGATLLRVDVGGKDDFYLEYEVFGIKIRFYIGVKAEVKRLFGSIEAFPSIRTINPNELNDELALMLGTVDEALGATESLEKQIRRDMREAGLEDIAPWIRNSHQALLITMKGAAEGWSPGRIATELAKTNAFHERYEGFKTFQAMPGNKQMSIIDLTAKYVDYENQIIGALRRFRGPDTTAHFKYVGKLISMGWTPEGVVQLLEGERLLKQAPHAFQELNEILALNGMEPVTQAEHRQEMDE